MESALVNADAFEANQIGMDLLGQVDDWMLKDIGISPEILAVLWVAPP